MSDIQGVAELGDTEDVKRDTKFSRDRLDALAEHFGATDAGELPWEEATDVTLKRPELEQISIRLSKEDPASLKRRRRGRESATRRLFGWYCVDISARRRPW